MTGRGEGGATISLLAEVKPGIADPPAAVAAQLRSAGETSAEVRASFDDPSPAFARFVQITVDAGRVIEIADLLRRSGIVVSVTKEPPAQP